MMLPSMVPVHTLNSEEYPFVQYHGAKDCAIQNPDILTPIYDNVPSMNWFFRLEAWCTTAVQDSEDGCHF